MFEKLVFLDPREKREKMGGLVLKENEVHVETMAFRVFKGYEVLLERRAKRETREIRESLEIEEKLDGLDIQEIRVYRE